jgi:hypothetical protein
VRASKSDDLATGHLWRNGEIFMAAAYKVAPIPVEDGTGVTSNVCREKRYRKKTKKNTKKHRKAREVPSGKMTVR